MNRVMLDIVRDEFCQHFVIFELSANDYGYHVTEYSVDGDNRLKTDIKFSYYGIEDAEEAYDNILFNKLLEKNNFTLVADGEDITGISKCLIDVLLSKTPEQQTTQTAKFMVESNKYRKLPVCLNL